MISLFIYLFIIIKLKLRFIMNKRSFKIWCILSSISRCCVNLTIQIVCNSTSWRCYTSREKNIIVPSFLMLSKINYLYWHIIPCIENNKELISLGNHNFFGNMMHLKFIRLFSKWNNISLIAAFQFPNRLNLTYDSKMMLMFWRKMHPKIITKNNKQVKNALFFISFLLLLYYFFFEQRTLLVKNFGRLIFGHFLSHFGQISDTLLKQGESRFTPTKEQLHWNIICENDILSAPSRFLIQIHTLEIIIKLGLVEKCNQ